MKNTVIQYIAQRYQVQPDRPWQQYPDDLVFRHADNRKWFALLMTISKSNLGMRQEGHIDVINLKCDPAAAGSLRLEPGVYPGYHMNHDHWISVVLDGTVPMDRVAFMLDMSYELTASRRVREIGRGPVDWILPANSSYFDVEAAFTRSPALDWHQRAKVMAGDRVYIYVGAPVSALKYLCRVTAADLPSAEGGSTHRYMELRLITRLDPERYPFSFLKQHGVGAVRGIRRMPPTLAKIIEKREQVN